MLYVPHSLILSHHYISCFITLVLQNIVWILQKECSFSFCYCCKLFFVLFFLTIVKIATTRLITTPDLPPIFFYLVYTISFPSFISYFFILCIILIILNK
eukprot:UN04054